jgi:hypothetical protein
MQALRLAAYFESFKKSLSLNDPQTAVPNALAESCVRTTISIMKFSGASGRKVILSWLPAFASSLYKSLAVSLKMQTDLTRPFLRFFHFYTK